MANNVLNLTRVENQTILTEVTRFNLSEQIRGAVLLLAEKWTPKNLYMDMQFGEHMICANEELLKQVWINLLDNAIKFSDPNGTVSVDISDGSECLSISVSNHGKDIPKDRIAHIFNKFYQADESHSSEGNGIGLAVVKKYVSCTAVRYRQKRKRNNDLYCCATETAEYVILLYNNSRNIPAVSFYEHKNTTGIAPGG